MIELHPILSGFPPAFFVLLLCAEFARLLRGGDRWESVASVAALAVSVATIASFLSGYQASNSAGEVQEAVAALLSTHHALGRLLLINSLLIVTFRMLQRVAVRGRGVFSTLYCVCLIAHVALTVTVGRMGGELVFDHGVGVDKTILAPRTP